ncbi:hypothetical protein HK405_002863 [Cladochytrium tenue]|nr:hypothetical protein HK405_002863 [Cladochytrium tenue]
MSSGAAPPGLTATTAPTAAAAGSLPHEDDAEAGVAHNSSVGINLLSVAGTQGENSSVAAAAVIKNSSRSQGVQSDAAAASLSAPKASASEGKRTFAGGSTPAHGQHPAVRLAAQIGQDLLAVLHQVQEAIMKVGPDAEPAWNKDAEADGHHNEAVTLSFSSASSTSRTPPVHRAITHLSATKEAIQTILTRLATDLSASIDDAPADHRGYTQNTPAFTSIGGEFPQPRSLLGAPPAAVDPHETRIHTTDSRVVGRVGSPNRDAHPVRASSRSSSVPSPLLSRAPPPFLHRARPPASPSVAAKMRLAHHMAAAEGKGAAAAGPSPLSGGVLASTPAGHGSLAMHFSPAAISPDDGPAELMGVLSDEESEAVQLRRLERRLRSAQAVFSEVSEKNTVLEAEIRVLSRQRDRLAASEARQSAQIWNLELKNQQLRESNSALEVANSKARAQIRALEARATTLREEIDQLSGNSPSAAIDIGVPTTPSRFRTPRRDPSLRSDIEPRSPTLGHDLGSTTRNESTYSALRGPKRDRASSFSSARFPVTGGAHLYGKIGTLGTPPRMVEQRTVSASGAWRWTPAVDAPESTPSPVRDPPLSVQDPSLTAEPIPTRDEVHSGHSNPAELVATLTSALSQTIGQNEQLRSENEDLRKGLEEVMAMLKNSQDIAASASVAADAAAAVLASKSPSPPRPRLQIQTEVSRPMDAPAPSSKAPSAVQMSTEAQLPEAESQRTVASASVAELDRKGDETDHIIIASCGEPSSAIEPTLTSISSQTMSDIEDNSPPDDTVEAPAEVNRSLASELLSAGASSDAPVLSLYEPPVMTEIDLPEASIELVHKPLLTADDTLTELPVVALPCPDAPVKAAASDPLDGTFNASFADHDPAMPPTLERTTCESDSSDDDDDVGEAEERDSPCPSPAAGTPVRDLADLADLAFWINSASPLEAAGSTSAAVSAPGDADHSEESHPHLSESPSRNYDSAPTQDLTNQGPPRRPTGAAGSHREVERRGKNKKGPAGTRPVPEVFVFGRGQLGGSRQSSGSSFGMVARGGFVGVQADGRPFDLDSRRSPPRLSDVTKNEAAAIDALTETMVGSWFLKYNRHKRNPKLSFSHASAASLDPHHRNFPPNRDHALTIHSHTRSIVIVPTSWHDHATWVLGLNALLSQTDSIPLQRRFWQLGALKPAGVPSSAGATSAAATDSRASSHQDSAANRKAQASFSQPSSSAEAAAADGAAGSDADAEYRRPGTPAGSLSSAGSGGGVDLLRRATTAGSPVAPARLPRRLSELLGALGQRTTADYERGNGAPVGAGLGARGKLPDAAASVAATVTASREQLPPVQRSPASSRGGTPKLAGQRAVSVWGGMQR